MIIPNSLYKKGLELAIEESIAPSINEPKKLPIITDYQNIPDSDSQTYFIVWAIMLSIIGCPLSSYEMDNINIKRVLSSYISSIEIPEKIIQRYHKRVLLYEIFTRYAHWSVLKFLRDESIYVEVLEDVNSDDGESRLTKILFDKSEYERYIVSIVHLREPNTYIYKNKHFNNTSALRNFVESDLRKQFGEAGK